MQSDCPASAPDLHNPMATAAEETRSDRDAGTSVPRDGEQTDTRNNEPDGSNKAREASRQTTLADFIVHPAQNNTRGNNSAADSDPEAMVTRSTRRERDGLSGKASGSTTRVTSGHASSQEECESDASERCDLENGEDSADVSRDERVSRSESLRKVKRNSKKKDSSAKTKNLKKK